MFAAVHQIACERTTLTAVLVLIGTLATACMPVHERWDADIGDHPDSSETGPELLWDDENEDWIVEPRFLGLSASSLLASGHDRPDESEAMVMRIRTSPELNLYREQPHSVMLQVIQLEHTRRIGSSRNSASGLTELIDAPMNVDGVIHSDEVYAEPASEAVYRFTRIEGARHVLIVSGHFEGDPAAITRLVRIPVLPDRVDGWHPATPGNLATKLPMIGPENEDFYPARLRIWLELGRDGIDRMDVTAH